MIAAPINRPPLLPPAIASRLDEVYFCAINHSAAAIKSSNTFCFFSFFPFSCHSRPYSPPPTRSFRARARPRHDDQGLLDRNIRVFALRHGVVAQPTPNQNASQQHPGNLWVFHEESRNVLRLFDSFLIALMRHALDFCLRNHGKRIAFLHKLCPNRDNFFSGTDSRNRG